MEFNNNGSTLSDALQRIRRAWSKPLPVSLRIWSPEAALNEAGLPEPNDGCYTHEDEHAEHDTGDAVDNRCNCVGGTVAGYHRHDESKAALGTGVGPTTVAEMESRETRDTKIKKRRPKLYRFRGAQRGDKSKSSANQATKQAL
jgi:hypothetical protein